MLCHRIPIRIIHMAHEAVKTRCTLLKHLLKCICHTQLPVHHDPMPVPDSHPFRFHQFLMSPGRHRTEIMAIAVNCRR